MSQIEKGGAADLDGRLTISDEITHINTHSIINVSHPQVTSMIREAAAQGEMLLGVQRLIPKGPRDVVINKPKSQSSFGFVLQSRTSLPGCKICECTSYAPFHVMVNIVNIYFFMKKRKYCVHRRIEICCL